MVGVLESSLPCLTNPSKNSTESFLKTRLTFSIFSTDGVARIRVRSSILLAVAGRGGWWSAVRGDEERERDKRSERVYELVWERGGVEVREEGIGRDWGLGLGVS